MCSNRTGVETTDDAVENCGLGDICVRGRVMHEQTCSLHCVSDSSLQPVIMSEETNRAMRSYNMGSITHFLSNIRRRTADSLSFHQTNS